MQMRAPSTRPPRARLSRHGRRFSWPQSAWPSRHAVLNQVCCRRAGSTCAPGLARACAGRAVHVDLCAVVCRRRSLLSIALVSVSCRMPHVVCRVSCLLTVWSVGCCPSHVACGLLGVAALALSTARCTLSVICYVCMLHVPCCPLHVASCMLPVACCPLHVVVWVLQRWRCLWRGVRCQLSVTCCMLHVPCCPLHVACRPLWSVATPPVATAQPCPFAVAQGRACTSSRCCRSSAARCAINGNNAINNRYQ